VRKIQYFPLATLALSLDRRFGRKASLRMTNGSFSCHPERSERQILPLKRFQSAENWTLIHESTKLPASWPNKCKNRETYCSEACI
jgi:hypothetical protein